MRKSHSCYKLTLSDGIGERVIMSSIKAYYTTACKTMAEAIALEDKLKADTHKLLLG